MIFEATVRAQIKRRRCLSKITATLIRGRSQMKLCSAFYRRLSTITNNTSPSWLYGRSRTKQTPVPPIEDESESLVRYSQHSRSSRDTSARRLECPLD